jgi:ataxia telangiectasia mutated family protein
MLLLMPHFASAGLPQLQTFEADIQSLTLQLIHFLRDSGLAYQALMETLLQAVQPYLTPCDSYAFRQLPEKAPHLLQFFVIVAEEFDRRRHMLMISHNGGDDDLMDLDDEFSTQQSQTKAEGQLSIIPRQCSALETSPVAFSLVSTERLMLLATINDSPNSSGFVPSTFVDRLLSLDAEEFLACRQLLQEIMASDLVVDAADAIRLINHIGEILSSSEFSRCEIAQSLCLDVLVGFGELWSTDSNFAEPASDLYQWFIDVALDGDIASPEVKKGIARLLLKVLLLRIEPMNGPGSSLPSSRSSLINVLQKGNASVKFYIGNQLPEIFELFILKDHDAVFVDVLENLPSDPDWIEGISFRLFVLARLASKWSTLLRRCIYHIFEIPGKIPDSVGHATRCLVNISSALKVDSPRELFALFAPQLLYTWLESDNIEDIPYSIFGFSSLKDLLLDAQQEAAGLMIMRGQDVATEYLAEVLGVSKVELLQNCFAKVMAYTIAYDISTPPPDKTQRHVTGEARVKKCLNQESFFECVNLYFVDIIALFFNTIDQGDVEKYLMRKEELVYAGQIMKEIKLMNSSDVALPQNQQPTFRAKYLIHWIHHLCTRTPYEMQDLYTPALVTSVARKLLNTIHPALGSLHACSVLRKLRILISLSGNTAINGYPLEMLLQSVCAFITDPECADDAIGIVKYLLVRGSDHLSQSPSFVAGIALSILGSLRVFLQSQEATQDTQYRATMSRAQNFHAWMKNYVSEYRSPKLQSKSKANFRALVQSAYNIGLVGNANIGSPESDLLFRLLQDEQADESLLSRPAREFALEMLCSDFDCPTSFRTDIFGSDELAIANAAVVWKSCRVASASKQYLSWAGRVLGRAFSASGHIHQELLQESSLSQIKELPISPDSQDSSRARVLSLLQSLTLSHDQRTIGLAESALRVIVTTSDDLLAQTCRHQLSAHLLAASTWAPYQPPPSETKIDRVFIESLSDPFTVDAIQRPNWLRDLAVIIAQFVPDEPVLLALVPILREVTGFAERTFPFILHLVLSTQSQSQQFAKKQLSTAFAAWFGAAQAINQNSLKMLINSILYLRTQPLPKEKSSADRSHWLDIDYTKAAIAATHCGMFRTALLFTEEFYSEPMLSKSSRRSSAMRHDTPELPTELLLTIFQNIDDPDLYYGVPQSASLSTILARLEYEKDGPKSLAFRGAQYDSHVRRHDPESAQDVQSIVKALDALSLSGLSHSLLQSQQIVGMSSTSLESMFLTARKLEQWDIPVPSTSNNNAVTIYKAFQAIHNAPDHATILREINQGFDSTMASLIREDLSAGALHGALQTLTALVEMDEILSTRGSQEFEELTSRFESRANWMKTGK